MAQGRRHNRLPPRRVSGGTAVLHWCTPPGIGFHADPRRLSEQDLPSRARSSASLIDPNRTPQFILL